METVLLLGALGYGAYWLTRKGVEYARECAVQREHAASLQADRRRLLLEQRRRIAEAERNRREQRRKQNLLARNLQLALFQLRHAQDFRRAATFAAMAGEVPLAFRQRQFRRFKGKMIAHMATRLTAGGDPELLTQSLASLLQALGVASYEAEYIRAEAERRATAPRPQLPVPPYAQRLAQLQRDHHHRLSALQSLTGIDPGTKEQLIEDEDTRFQDGIRDLGNDAPDEGQATARGPQ